MDARLSGGGKVFPIGQHTADARSPWPAVTS